MPVENFIQKHYPNLQTRRLSENFPRSVLGTETNHYLNPLQLYMAYFGEIPNIVRECHVKCKVAAEWFIEKYFDEIIDLHYSKELLPKYQYSKESINHKPEFNELFFILENNILIYFDMDSYDIRFLFKKTNLKLIDEIRNGLTQFKETENHPGIFLLISLDSGVTTTRLEIERPKLRIEDNYNEDFQAIHQTIYNRLSTKNDKGLVLLHGKPGTGKTSYIRHLASSLDKRVIFLPPNMANAITNPNLMEVLTHNPNSIFVIEDAENIIIDREATGTSPVSTLLNLSDGLLSDCLNIQIICSFNTDLSKVDSALLRKGRLIAKYEFKELETEKAQKLSDKLGFKTQITSPMTLTDIYNQNEEDFKNQTTAKPIGFQF